jgi:TetR/AcrR family transcriptional regulator, regulator of autoinduction and epiphytic fitness
VVKPKRIRRDPDTTRGMILDATERVMIEEGYAAVSSRRIAQDIGLNAATIHYYYPTTDDLFIALHKRMIGHQLVELDAVLARHNPLEALWEFQSNRTKSTLALEFFALSNHRKSIQDELARMTADARDIQTKALERAIASAGLDAAQFPPIALSTILLAISWALANEERIGIVKGHKEVRDVVEWALNHLLTPRKASGDRAPSS